MALPRYVPHYTVADFEQWEGRWELWSGVPIAMSPSPNQRHQEIASNLHFALRQAMVEADCKDCKVLYEIDWRISQDSVVRPDMLIACGHGASEWIEETPQFVAEILSESNRNHDLLYKREMYEKLGVKYYLIVDPEDQSLQLFLNSETGFKPTEIGVLSLDKDCCIEPDLGSLFTV